MTFISHLSKATKSLMGGVGASRLRHFGSDRAGNVTVMAALMLATVASATGFSTDYSRAVNAKRELQSKLDAALLSAARREPGVRKEIAENYFDKTLSGRFAAESDVTEVSDTEITGIATADVPSFFGGLFLIPSLSVSAESKVTVAAVGGGAPAEPLRACIILESTDAQNALRVNGGADIISPGCEIHVNSTASPAANFNGGINLDVARVCIRGSRILNNNGTMENVETDCDALTNPFEDTLPVPRNAPCDYSNQSYTGGSLTLSPGVYCGYFNFNGAIDLTFEPGLYVIRGGGWNANDGEWRGEGVTFYFEDSSAFLFNNSVEANLSPPVEGDYAGILMFEKDGLRESRIVLNGSRSFSMEGLLYLPSRDVTFNSRSEIHAKDMTMVFSRLTLNDTRWDLTAGPLGVAAGTGRIVDENGSGGVNRSGGSTGGSSTFVGTIAN